MALSPKQEVYREMLWWTLPHLRDVAGWRRWLRLRDRSLHYETELIHNLPVSMFEPEFTDHDIWFLNWQAKAYYERCSAEKSALYPQQVERIARLFALVPDHLRSRLDWPGPCAGRAHGTETN